MSIGSPHEVASVEAREAHGGSVCKLVLHPPLVPFARAVLDAPRILIADDYEDAAESLGLLLQCTGARTEIALDGRKALATASHYRPDVCVLDLQKPGLDGREVARQIRAQSWDERPLLIALTGWTTRKDRISALEAGFDYYVTKPVEPSWLVRLIQAYCRVDVE
jgi:DNA-binding response OmpR family regulator